MAMPSPVSMTRPTSSRLTEGWKDSTCVRSASEISSGLIVNSDTSSLPFVRSGRQLLQRAAQLAPHAPIDDLVAYAGDHAADH